MTFISSLYKSLISLCFLCLALCVQAADYARVIDGDKAAVASVNPLATQAGLEAIARGGNAIDAALAVAFTLGVVDSNNSGIGGGCFILARLANGEILAIDGREMAPAAAFRDMYLRDGKVDASLSRSGALASGIPGSVAALYELQRRGGKLSFADVLLPAAELADKGFPVGASLASRVAATEESLRKFPASAAIFLPQGKPVVAGQILKQKDLAKTYRQLAKQGPKYFYQGHFAKKTAEWMKKNNGLITAKDFSSYHIVLREPLQIDYLGYKLYGFPPPSSGGVHVAQILKTLAPYRDKKLGEADRYHLLIEASKRAFADRAQWLGDSDFVAVPKALLDANYIQARAASIQLDKASSGVSYGLPPDYESLIFDKHTTHLSSADSEGNWVAITTTLNTSFGSKVVVPGTGVLLNNQMDDFAAAPGQPNAFGLLGSEANSIAPGKRPLSSMSPVLVFRGEEVLMALGAAGGPTIISQVSQTLFNHLQLQLSLPEAMRRGRVHHQWQPDMVFVDSYVDAAVRAELEKRGHTLREWPSFGATQAVSKISGHFEAESEPRIQSTQNR